MAKEYAIGIRFSAKDSVSTALGRIGLAGGAVEKTLGPSLQKAQQRLNAVGAAAARATVTVAGLGIAAIGAGIVSATRKYVAFDDAVTAAGAKFKDLDVTSADHKKHLDALQETALKVAGATRFTATDTAGALDKMAMAGLTASQSMTMLRGTASLASATGKDLTSAVDMATDALGAFNLTKDKFGQPLDDDGMARSLQRISDVVAKTTNMANTDMDMWFEAVKKGAPTFTSLGGGEIEAFSAMTGVLANSGIKGAEAGTALRNMVLNLASPAKAGADAMGRLGLRVKDARGNMLPLLDIMQQFERAFGNSINMDAYLKAVEKAGGNAELVNVADFMTGTGSAQKAADLNAIFGKRTVGSFLTLLNAGTQEIRSFENQLKNAQGAAQNMADAMDKSLKGRIEILKSALDTLGIRFAKAFEKDGADLVENLTKVVTTFEEQVLPKLIDTIHAAMPAIRGIIQKVIDAIPKIFDIVKSIVPILAVAAGVIGVVFNVVWALRGPLSTILALWGAWQVGMMLLVPLLHGISFAVTAYHAVVGFGRGILLAYRAAQAGVTLSIKGATVATHANTVATKAAAVGMKVAAAAQWFWNAAIMACPIAWIVAGIILLIGIIVVLAGKWQAVTSAVDGFFRKIRESGGIAGYIKRAIAAPFELVWNQIRGIFDIINAFKSGGFLAGFKMIGVAILQGLAAPLEYILELLSFIPGMDTLNEAIHTKLDTMRANILAGVTDPALPTDEDTAAPVPTQTAATASSYSREESFTTSKVEIGLADGLAVKSVSARAPDFTLPTGRTRW